MIDEAPHWLDTALRVFDRAIEHGAAYSIVVGWAIAIGLTQWIKRMDRFPSYKWAIRAMSLPFGFVTTFCLWPGSLWHFTAVKFFTALFVGVSSSWIYWLVMRAVYWKWPHLERHFSANPAPVAAATSEASDGS